MSALAKFLAKQGGAGLDLAARGIKRYPKTAGALGGAGATFIAEHAAHRGDPDVEDENEQLKSALAHYEAMQGARG